MKYEVSEGETQADWGQGDDTVVVRSEDNGWVNPLSITDDGTDDD